MTVIGLGLFSEARRRWRAWLGLGLVVGVLAGATLALVAGARRTDSAHDRFLREQNAFDLLVVNDLEGGTDSATYDLNALEDDPDVLDAARAAFEWLPLGPNSGTPGLASYDGSIGTSINAFKVLDGRRADPERADEAVVGFQIAESEGLEVGDQVPVLPPPLVPLIEAGDLDALEEIFGFPVPPDEVAATQAFLDRVPGGKVTVVGIVAAPGEVPPQYQGLLCCVHLTPAYGEVVRGGSEALALRLRGGASAIPAFVEELERRAGGAQPTIVRQDETTPGVDSSIGAQATALRLLAALVAGSAALILFQLLSRFTVSEAADHDTLAAMGATSRQLMGLALGRAVAAGLVGSLVAAVVLVVSSPLLPTGLARVVEPDPGVAVDRTVLVLGITAVPLVMALLAAWPAWRVAHVREWRRRGAAASSRSVRAMSRLALRPTVALGARLALDPGRGPRSVPVGTSLAAVVLGLAVVVGALTFDASLRHLLRSPALYGVTWDMAVWGAGSGFPVAAEVAPIADAREDVVAVAIGGVDTEVRVADTAVRIVGYDAISGDLLPPITDGVAPTAPGEVALGAATLARLDVDVGDTIGTVGDAGESEDLRIVGETVLPTSGDRLQLGEGGFATVATVLGLEGAPPEEAAGANVYLGLADGASRQEVLESLQGEVCDQPELFCAVSLFPQETPEDVVNFGRVRATPLILGAVLAVAAVMTLAHVLATSMARRRRELAAAEALGFTRPQVGLSVAVQASTLALIAVLLALPLGTALGSVLWNLRVVDLGIVSERRVPWLALVLVALGTLAVANALAVVVRRLVLRAPAAERLHAE